MGSISPSILLVKTSAIGDVIQTFPVLEYLRQKYPEAQIDWVVEQASAPLLRAHPQISHVIEMHTRAWRRDLFSAKTRNECANWIKRLRTTSYDLLFDLQGNTKSALVTKLAKAKEKVGFDWRGVREKTNLLATTKRLSLPPSLDVRSKYLRLVQQYFTDESSFVYRGIGLQISVEERNRLEQILSSVKHPSLMVCFGSKWKNKRLEEKRLLSLLQRISTEYASSFLFIFGDLEEKQTAEKLAATFGNQALAVGDLSLPLWQVLMGEVDGVIAVDSAALHLCGTTGTPSFSVFGPSLASSYKPLGEHHVALQGTCPYGRSFAVRCPALRTCPTGACMHHFPEEELFSAFQKWFQVVLGSP